MQRVASLAQKRRYIFLTLFLIGLCTVIFWSMAFGEKSTAVLFSWMLFFFSWLMVVTTTYAQRRPEETKKYNEWAGDDGLFLHVLTWVGIMGSILGATALYASAAC